MRRKAVWVVAASCATAYLLSFGTTHARHNVSGRRPAVRAQRPRAQPLLPVRAEVPSFSYLDQDRHPVSNTQLLGHVWIADFIFTHCTTACPILSAHTVLLQRKIRNPDVRFISFSVDPEHDTPEVLKEYASRWSADEGRWRLLSTSKRTLPGLIAPLGVVADETGDPDDPIIHTSAFLVVDQGGLVRGAYDSADAEDMKRLVVDVESLVRDGGSKATAKAEVPKAAMAGELNGQKLFVELGCQGCHAQAQVAIPLAGLFGSIVTLTDKRKVKVDEAYLRESIIDPSAKVVAGYLATMPSYAGQLTEAQLSALVGYLKTLDGAEVATPVHHLAVDPVCKMEISAGADVLHVEYKGKTYYFCSETCHRKFSQNPARYELR